MVTKLACELSFMPNDQIFEKKISNLRKFFFYFAECIAVHPQLSLVASGQAKGNDDEVDDSHVQVTFIKSEMIQKIACR